MSRRKSGPPPQFTECVEVCFSPEHLSWLTQQAKDLSISRNALVRIAVSEYRRRLEMAK